MLHKLLVLKSNSLWVQRAVEADHVDCVGTVQVRPYFVVPHAVFLRETGKKRAKQFTFERYNKRYKLNQVKTIDRTLKMDM